MLRHINKFLLTLAFSVLGATHAWAFGDSLGISPFEDWKTITTENFRITFPAELEPIAQKTAAYFEQAHTALMPKMFWQPRQRTQVILVDNTDLANGLASAALRFGHLLMLTPPDAWFSTAYYDDWLKLLVFHEYTHLLNMDVTHDFMEILRWAFGDIIRPNGLWPRWMLEGYAVYNETRYTSGGRGRSPYWDMILRTAVEQNVLDTSAHITLDRLGGDIPYQPYGETPYFFGYNMINQVALDPENRKRTQTADDLELVKDSDDLLGLMSYRSGGRLPFFINDNLRNITGKTWYEYWDEWIEATRTRAREQLAQIRKQPVTTYSALSDGNTSVQGFRPSPDGRLIAYKKDSSDDTRGLYLRNLETSEDQRIVDKKVYGMGMAFSPDSSRLFFSGVRPQGGYSTLSDLAYYDLPSGRVRWLTDSQRYKDPDVSSDGKTIVFAYNENISTGIAIAEIAEGDGHPSIQNVKKIYVPVMLDRASHPRFIDGGRAIAFSLHINGKLGEDLMRLDLASGKTTTLVSDGHFNRYPSPGTGGEILFVSDKSRVDNVYRVRPGERPRAVTNVTTGAWFPAQDPRGTLYASVYEYQGWRLAKIGNAQAITDAPSVTPPPAPDAVKTTPPSEKYEVDDYSIFPSILPRVWAPTLLFRPYSTTIGASASGFDALDRHQYSLLADYDSGTRKPDLGVLYSNRQLGATLTWVGTQYTSSTISSGSKLYYFTRRTEATASASYTFRFENSSLTPTIAASLVREELFDTAQRSSSIAASQLLPYYDAILSYTDADASRLAITPESGGAVALAGRLIAEKDAPVFKGLVTARRYFKLMDHTVLTPAIAGSWVTHQGLLSDSSVTVGGQDGPFVRLFNPQSGATMSRIGLRGYPAKTRLVRSAALGSMDLRFPLLRIFRGVGTHPMFLENLHGFIFGESAAVSQDRGLLYLPAAGGGVRLNLHLAEYIPLTLSVEFHRGFKSSEGGRSEALMALFFEGLGLF